MNKFLIAALFIIFTCNITKAAEWVSISENLYIDKTSLKKDLYGFSFLAKSFLGEYFFVSNRYSINCKDGKITLLETGTYDINNRLINRAFVGEEKNIQTGSYIEALCDKMYH